MSARFSRRKSVALGLVAMVAALTFMTSISAADAAPVYETRDTMLNRAKSAVYGTWVAPRNGGWRYTRFYAGRTYTGTAYTQNNPQENWWTFRNNMAAGIGSPGGTQGNDCSGFVSSVWMIGRETTYSIQRSSNAYRLPGYSSLLRGDLLNKRNSEGGHMAMFDRRTTSGMFMVYEQTPPKARHRSWSWSYTSSRGYVPYRRVRISEEWTKPAGSMSAPASGSTIHTGDTVTVSGNFTDNRSVSEVEFYAEYDATPGDSVNFRPWRLIGVDTRGGRGSYFINWKVGAPANQTIRIKAIPYDATGNAGQFTVTPLSGIKVERNSDLRLASDIETTPSLFSVATTTSVSFQVENPSAFTNRVLDVKAEVLTAAAKFSATTVWDSGRDAWQQARAKSVAGDFDGDSRADIASLMNEDDAQTKARILNFDYLGVTEKTWWDSGRGMHNWPNLKVVAGDFDGDDIADVAFMKDTGYKTAELWTLRSNTSTFSPMRWWDENRTGYWSVPNNKVVAGDFNGDGKDDIAALYNYGSSNTKIWVFLSTGTGFTAPIRWWTSAPGAWDATRSTPLAGDFNGDGRDDLGIVYDSGSTRTRAWVMLSTGSKFFEGLWWDSSSLGYGFAPSRIKPAAGDFTGDGRADIAFLYDSGNSTARLLVLPSAGSKFNAPATWWARTTPGGWSWQRSTVVAGDLNGDHRSDIAVLYDASYGHVRVWQFLSGAWLAFPSTGALTLSPGASYTYSRSLKMVPSLDQEIAATVRLSDGKYRRVPLPEE